MVLNHIDEVPADRRQAMVDDVRRLVDADGLSGVPVLATSARTGEGIDELRDEIARAGQGQEGHPGPARGRRPAGCGAPAGGQRHQPRTRSCRRRGSRPSTTPSPRPPAYRPSSTPSRSATRLRANRATGWPVDGLALPAAARPPQAAAPRPRHGGQAVHRPWPDVRARPDPGPAGRGRRRGARRGRRGVRAAGAALGRLRAPGLGLAAARPERPPRLRAVGRPTSTPADPGLGRPGAGAPVAAAGHRGRGGGVARRRSRPTATSASRSPPRPTCAGFPVPTVMLLGGILLGILLSLVCRLLVSATARSRARSADRRLRSAIAEVADELVVDARAGRAGGLRPGARGARPRPEVRPACRPQTPATGRVPPARRAAAAVVGARPEAREHVNETEETT